MAKNSEKEENNFNKADAKKILPIELDDLHLNLREYKFIAAYCANGFKGAEAAKTAGYKGRNNAVLSAMAHSVLKRQDVIIAVKRFVDLIIKPFKDRLEYEVMTIYYNRATYNIRDFYDDFGSVKPLSEIPDTMLCCIDGVEKKYFGKDADRSVVTYTLPNRDTALQTLYKYVAGNIGPEEATAPASALDNVKNIFSKAMDSSETQIKKRITQTLEDALKDGRGAGRPKKIKGITHNAKNK